MIKPVKKAPEVTQSEAEKISKRKTDKLNSSSSSSESSDSDNDKSGPKESSHKKLKTSLAPRKDDSAAKSTIAETSQEGNMILLKGDDSLWKNAPDKASSSVLVDEKKSRETDFEDYLEDLLF